MRILVADRLDAAVLASFSREGVEVVDRSGIDPSALAEEIGDYDALVVRSRTKVTEALLRSSDRLRVVGRAGTGIDNIALGEATRRGVLVMNAPGANSNSAAEHTIALMLSLFRRIPQADAALRTGAWNPTAFTGYEAHGKTLAVIGLGRIGRLVASKARGLGMKVVGFDPVIAPEVAAKEGIELLELDLALSRADVVSLHVPLNHGTRHLLSKQRIANLKPGVRIINCARGGLIDEEALHEALESGQVAGVALDVFEVEPPTESPLMSRPDVVVTPHLGASTHEAQARVASEILERVSDYLVTGRSVGALNGLSFDDETRELVAPFLDLAHRLGRIAAGLNGELSGLTARYYGPVPSKNARALTSHFLKGFLSCFLADEVNELNSFQVARDRGIVVDEVLREEHRSFQNVLFFRLTRQGDGQGSEIAGTTFGKTSLRIVRIDGHNLDAVPEGLMLVVENRDLPGIMGSVTSALGAAKVNIGNMSLGRDRDEGCALAVLNLDGPPPSATLAQIRQIDGIQAVRLVNAEK